MKYALVVFAAILLSGCGLRESEGKPGFRSVKYSLVCIEGVTYIEHAGLTVKLDKDSKIVPCD